MKKVISVLLVAVCIGMALPAQAQLKFGLKGGLNVAKVTFDEDILGSDNMAGFFIGPMAEFTLPIVGLGVDGALLFSQKGIKSDSDATKQLGLDIPINLKYTIGLGSMVGVFIAAGPDFYFDFSKDKEIAGIELEKKSAQVGINVGAGVKLIKHLQIGVNYNIPLGDSFTFKNAWNAATSGAKTKTWQVSAAYIF